MGRSAKYPGGEVQPGQSSRGSVRPDRGGASGPRRLPEGLLPNGVKIRGSGASSGAISGMEAGVLLLGAGGAGGMGGLAYPAPAVGRGACAPRCVRSSP